MFIAGENLINVPLLRNQLRGFDMLAAIRLYRHGFPEYLTFREFRRLFEPLVNARDGGGSSQGQLQESKRDREARGGAKGKAKIPYLGDDKLVCCASGAEQLLYSSVCSYLSIYPYSCLLVYNLCSSVDIIPGIISSNLIA